jgi:hypothetical protein
LNYGTAIAILTGLSALVALIWFKCSLAAR